VTKTGFKQSTSRIKDYDIASIPACSVCTTLYLLSLVEVTSYCSIVTIISLLTLSYKLQVIVMDFIKALPGNSSVNILIYTGGQQQGRSVFYVVRAATVDLYC
jgi:hypothetical protein